MKNPVSLGIKAKQKNKPVWFMRQAGRYLPEYQAIRKTAPDFIAFCMDSEKAATVTCQPITRFQFDAAIVFADILLIPHALGQSVRFIAGEGPRLGTIDTPEDLRMLQADGAADKLQPVYETLKNVRQQLPPTTNLIGFAGSPWTVACYMLQGRSVPDFPRIKQWAYAYTEGFDALIHMLIEATAAYLLQQVAAGADTIQLFDSWAGVASSALFIEYCIKPTQQIVHALKAQYPHITVIGFPRLAGANLLEYAAIEGLDGIGLDTTVPMAWACEQLPSHLFVQGNLDPYLLQADGAKAAAAALAMMTTCAQYNRAHVVNLGHGINKETPIGHVEQVLAAIRATSAVACDGETH